MRHLAFGFIALLCTLCAQIALASAPPNIVFFYVDDLGARDVGCYGSSFYETPHIDKLAADGLRFERAYSAFPRCISARKSLMSGKTGYRLDHDNPFVHTSTLPLREVTFAETLQEHGYRTSYIGKWHIGGEGYGPAEQGFEVAIHTGLSGSPETYFYPFPPSKGKQLANPVEGQDGDYLTDNLTEAAVQQLRTHAQDDAPFLMVLAHYGVHTPLEAPPPLVEKYQDKLDAAGIAAGGGKDDPDLKTQAHTVFKTAQNSPTYAAMIERVDASLGRVLETLDELDLTEDTVVVFTSDHGGLSTRGLESTRPLATSNLPLRQGKGSIYEGGIRVPLIVRWPGHIQPGSVTGVQTTGTDHYPTFLEIAGLPLKPKQHADGQSYLPALRGETYTRAAMYWHKTRESTQYTGDKQARVVVYDDYKLIKRLDGSGFELYNLTNDISEQHDLAESKPSTLRMMRRKLREVSELNTDDESAN